MNSGRRPRQHTVAFVRSSIVILFLTIASASIHANDFRSTSLFRSDFQGFEATQVEPTISYQTYESTIFEPFSDETPSSNTSNGPSRISNRKNGAIGGFDENEWGSNSDPDEQENMYPLGDAWSLLIFAALAAAVIYIQRRRNLPAENNKP